MALSGAAISGSAPTAGPQFGDQITTISGLPAKLVAIGAPGAVVTASPGQRALSLLSNSALTLMVPVSELKICHSPLRKSALNSPLRFLMLSSPREVTPRIIREDNYGDSGRG